MKKVEFNLVKKLPYLLLILILSFSNQKLPGQRNVKYKDVFKVVEEKSKEEAYSLLLVYQKQDPFFANTYVQLGQLAQFWSKDYDALTDPHDVDFFIYNTNLYYGLAMSKIDQKEVRKNDKFYMNIDRFKNREKIEFEEVRSFMQEQIDANNEYSRNVQIVTRLFNSSIKHYNNCIKVFKEINTNNNKIKDIYLTADAKFMLKLNELESSFDSTIYYLQNYQTAIKNYPIKAYNQKYKLLPIETYRLHGLTGSDFLKDEIPIWNYGIWVKNVKNILNTDIDDIRNLIKIADQKLNENISLLVESREYKTDFLKQKVDDKLKFKIGKYDYQSILLELFKFKESKIDFLANQRDPCNNINDTVNYTIIQKAKYYEGLIKAKELCDSLNNNLGEKINPYDINKYSEFFTKNYGGEPGLKNYLKNENIFLKLQLKSSFNNLKEYLIQSLTKTDIKSDTIHNNVHSIELSVSAINLSNANSNICYTSDYEENGAGDFYITGYFKESGSSCYPFVAKTNKKTDIEWFKLITSSTANSAGIFIQAKEDGCEILVHTPMSLSNQILIFDNEGKQKDKLDLGISAVPRYFNYDEINQKYLLVFKGSKQDQLECIDDELIISQYDGLVKKITWQQSLKLKGTFVDVFTLNQNVFLVSNFSHYESPTLTINSTAGSSPKNTNAIIIGIDQAGNVTKEIPLLNDKPFFITNSVKINSNTINLLGFRNELLSVVNPPKSGFGELVYLLLNSDCNLYFDNSKL